MRAAGLDVQLRVEGHVVDIPPGVDLAAYLVLQEALTNAEDAPRESLYAGVRTVAAGDALLAPSVTRRLIERHLRLAQPSPQLVRQLGRLTEREREVLTLVARGLSNADIAAALHLREATVRTHVGHVFAKLGARDRAQAVVFAYESGLVRAGDSL